MRGTKFVVVKMKELVKTAVFAVLGVIILFGLIWFFLNLGNDANAATYRDGTYHTQVKLHDEWAMVSVTIQDGWIQGVSISETSESARVFYPLLDSAVQEVAKEVVKKQSLEIGVSPQNAYSAQVILEGVARGLEAAIK